MHATIGLEMRSIGPWYYNHNCKGCIAHYWLNKGYIEIYENGGKIWVTSSPSCHNPNSISKLEYVLTLFYVPWFLREHTHTQNWLLFWHCPNCLEHFLLRGDLFIFLLGYYRGYYKGIVWFSFSSLHFLWRKNILSIYIWDIKSSHFIHYIVFLELP